jgi:Cu(I)/Ag(I) efflux system protein CusF
MKKSMVAVSLALAAALSVQAAEPTGMKMEGMKMDEAAAKAPVNHTTGVVKELDAPKGTITLAHQSVPTLKWPAMTMTFKITPELAKGVEVGQKVDFEFETKGKSATITRISPVR